VTDAEQRIALFVDFENLALGARDRGEVLDMSVVMDALSERGRVVARRAAQVRSSVRPSTIAPQL
jgi:hypothetical protein